MERQKNKLTWYSIAALYVIFLVGIIGHTIPAAFETMLLLTPYTLLLTNAIVIYPIVVSGSKAILIWLSTIFLITLLLEIIGVKTGIIFGDYLYGSVLGFRVFGVPLIIGLNWTVIILACAIITGKMGNIFAASLTAGLLAVLLDVFIEPIAVKLGYWSWTSGEIPLQNYAAWFTISFLSVFMFKKLNIKISDMLPVHIYFVQLIFFISINVFL